MIALSPDTVAALQKEIESIHARMEGLRRRLADDQKALDSIHGLLAINGSRAAESSAESEAEGMKFRDLIKLVVAEKQGEKLSITDVVDLIIAKGYTRADDAKTPLKTKVGNELFKLARNELIGKDGKGSYWAL